MLLPPMIEKSIGSPEDLRALWTLTSSTFGISGAASGPLMSGQIALRMSTFQLQTACAFKRVHSIRLSEVICHSTILSQYPPGRPKVCSVRHLRRANRGKMGRWLHRTIKVSVAHCVPVRRLP